MKKELVKFEDMNYENQKYFVELFANWLNTYTHEVIVKVMEQKDEIINNEFAVMMLEELNEREKSEYKDFTCSIEMLLRDFDGFAEFDPHNHALSHAKSYRDVLHDMYIKNK